MKVVFYELEGWENDYLKERLGDKESVFLKERLSTDNVHEDADAISVFIYSKVNGELLDKMPNLKMIATRSTGFDHIDLEECKKRGIKVYNVPFYGENTVAEHAMALLLALVRKIPRACEQTSKFNFSMEGLRGHDVKGRTMGVIGTGHIGQNMIRISDGFGMNVIAYDPFPKDLSLNFKYVDLDTLFRESDFISLHVPYNEHTHHLINRDAIDKMKEGVIIINTARGGVIDTQALVDGLKSGKIGGAGLDVLEGEHEIIEEAEILKKEYPIDTLKNLLTDHILMTFPNVIVTPHIAFNTYEALYRILDTTIDNLNGKREPLNN